MKKHPFHSATFQEPRLCHFAGEAPQPAENADAPKNAPEADPLEAGKKRIQAANAAAEGSKPEELAAAADKTAPKSLGVPPGKGETEGAKLQPTGMEESTGIGLDASNRMNIGDGLDYGEVGPEPTPVEMTQKNLDSTNMYDTFTTLLSDKEMSTLNIKSLTSPSMLLTNPPKLSSAVLLSFTDDSGVLQKMQMGKDWVVRSEKASMAKVAKGEDPLEMPAPVLKECLTKLCDDIKKLRPERPLTEPRPKKKPEVKPGEDAKKEEKTDPKKVPLEDDAWGTTPDKKEAMKSGEVKKDIPGEKLLDAADMKKKFATLLSSDEIKTMKVALSVQQAVLMREVTIKLTVKGKTFEAKALFGAKDTIGEFALPKTALQNCLTSIATALEKGKNETKEDDNFGLPTQEKKE